MQDSRRQSGKHKLQGKVIQLIDLVDYQRGSIVSREIINKKQAQLHSLLLIRDRD